MFKNLLDSAPVAVLVSRISDGEVLYANHKLAAMVGLSLDQLIGEKTPDFYFDPSDRERVLEALKTKGKVENFELHVKRADGTPFWVETSFEPITFEGEPAIVAGYIDITERKRVDDALIQARARLSDAVDSMSDGFAIFDADDRLIYCNLQYQKYWPGFEDLLIPGTRFEDIARAGAERGLFEDAVGRVEDWTRERVAQHRAAEGLVELHLADGRWDQAVDRRTREGGIVCIRTDITERKQAEWALRESEERYALAAKGTNDGLWEWNIETNEGHFSARWKEIVLECGTTCCRET